MLINSLLQATGDNGRILKEDILKHLGMAEQPSTQLPPTPKVSAYTVDRVEPIKGIRKVSLCSILSDHALLFLQL